MQKYLSQILLIFLVAPIYSYAQFIPCPAVNLIQDGAIKIDVATKPDKTYTVYTMEYVFFESNVYWRVGANQIIATSDEDAIQKGKELVRHAASKDQEEAMVINPGFYKCTYSPGHSYALGFTK